MDLNPFSPRWCVLVGCVFGSFSLSEARPETSPELFFTGGSLSENWEQLGPDINEEKIDSRLGSAVALSSDGLTSVAGAPSVSPYGGPGFGEGFTRVFRFDLELNNWAQIGQVIEGEFLSEENGESVDISADGTIVIVGAMGHGALEPGGTGSGRIFRFDESSGTWVQLGQQIIAPQGGSVNSVALNADGLTAILGMSTLGSKVDIYTYNENLGVWEQLGQSIPRESGENGANSVALSADGGVAAVGSPSNDDNGASSGQVRVYRFNDGSGEWEQLGTDLNGEAEGDNSGNAIALSADGLTVMIGAPDNDGNASSSGHVRIYRFSEGSGTWAQLGGDLEGEDSGSLLGASVALSDDGCMAIVGAPGSTRNASPSGEVRVYRFNRISEEWEQVGLSIDGKPKEGFGGAVDISSDGNIAIVGAAHRLNIHHEKSGKAQVFQLKSVYHYSQFEGITMVTDVMVTDDTDSEGAGITYSLSGIDSDLFTMSDQGVLSFMTAPDFEMAADASEDNTYELTVIATDSDLNTAEQAVEVHVLSSAPALSGARDIELSRDQSDSVTFLLSDGDSNVDDLVITAQSDNQDLISDSSLVFTGSGDTRILSIAPTQGKSGTANITVVVNN